MTATNGPEDPLSALRELWMQGAEPAPPLDANALRSAARRLRRRVWLRNATEWGAAALLLPLCVRAALGTERPGAQLGMLAVGAAGLYVSAVLYQRGRVGRQPESASTAQFLEAHVTAVGRQAQLLESVWRWYLLPFVPGITLVHLDTAWAQLTRSAGAHSARTWLTISASWLFCCLVFLGIGALNRRGARKLRREIAKLSEP